MRGSVGLVLQEGKLRDALERYFQSHRWRVLHLEAGELGRLEGRQPELLLFELSLMDRAGLQQIEKISSNGNGVFCLGLISKSQSVPDSPHAPNLRWLRKPFSRRQLEAAFPSERVQSATAQSIRSASNGRPKRPRIPIRAKITAPFMLLALALGLAAAFVVTRIVFDTVEERFTNQLIESGRLANEWMVLEEERLLGTQRALARTQGVAQALAAGDAEQLRRLALPLLVNDGVDAAEFVSAAGVNLLSLRHPAGEPFEVYESSAGDDLAELEAVRLAMRGARDARGDKYAEWVEADWGNFFYIVGPVYDGAGVVAGVVLVGEPGSEIVAGMRAATLAQVSLYNLGGAPIESTFLSFNALDASDLDYLGASPNASYMRPLHVINIDYLEILGPWSTRGERQLGYLGAALPQSFLVTANEWTRLQVFGTVAIGLGLVILVGVYIANRITDPLLQVVRASAEVAKGDLTVQVTAKGDDEVATLASTFNQMVNSLRTSRVELLRAYDSTLEGWSKALELRDDDTEGHTRRVVEITTKLAQAMGLHGQDLLNIRRGAMLHDIGKMGIPDEILRKPGSLDETEWEVMRRHPVYAREMLSNIDYLRESMDIPSYHHEKWDGTGYPYGLRGEAIPLAARIFAVADVFDALCSDRPYRSAWKVEAALDHIRQQSGIHFDPEVVKSFFAAIDSGEIEIRRQRQRQPV